MKKLASYILTVAMIVFSIHGAVLASTEASSINVSAGESVISDNNANQTEKDNMAKAGITPDSFLYGIDKFFQEVQLFFAYSPDRKADILCDVSEERLAEAKEMIDENKVKYAKVAMKAYVEVLKRAVEALDEAIIQDKDADHILEKYKETFISSKDIITEIVDQLELDGYESLSNEIGDALDDAVITVEVGDVDETDSDDEASNETYDSENKSEVENEEGVDNEDEGQPPDSEQGNGLEEDNENNDQNQSKTNENNEHNNKNEKINTIDKKEIVTDVLSRHVTDEVLLEYFKNGDLNLKQISAVLAMSELSGKSVEDTLEVLLEKKGIGKTAKELGIKPKAGLKATKKVFKNIKKEIKEEFKNALKKIDKPDVDQTEPDENQTETDESITEPDEDMTEPDVISNPDNAETPGDVAPPNETEIPEETQSPKEADSSEETESSDETESPDETEKPANTENTNKEPQNKGQDKPGKQAKQKESGRQKENKCSKVTESPDETESPGKTESPEKSQASGKSKQGSNKNYDRSKGSKGGFPQNKSEKYVNKSIEPDEDESDSDVEKCNINKKSVQYNKKSKSSGKVDKNNNSQQKNAKKIYNKGKNNTNNSTKISMNIKAKSLYWILWLH